jgi:hypothetical protein
MAPIRDNIQSAAVADRCNAKEPIKAAQAARTQGRSAQQLHTPVMAGLSDSCQNFDSDAGISRPPGKTCRTD